MRGQKGEIGGFCHKKACLNWQGRKSRFRILAINTWGSKRMTDLLTGLASRHQLHLCLPELAARATLAAPLSLLLLKIRDFSLWQGRLTPLAADHLLSLAAALLRQEVTNKAMAVRWSGATFALLLPAYPLWQAEELAELLRRAATAQKLPAIFAYEGFSLDFHYGCAALPPTDIWQLAATAEEALRRAEGGAFAALAKEPEPKAEREVMLRLARGFLNHGGAYLARLSLLAGSLALASGQRLGLDQAALADLELAAAFADIAMHELCGLALEKPGPLHESEWRKIQRHPYFAARLTESLGLSQGVTKTVLYHHERYDGLGYPEGLKGAAIPVSAAILHGSTVYASLLLPRPYRPARHSFTARTELNLLAGRALDPEIVRQLLLTDTAATQTTKT